MVGPPGADVAFSGSNQEAYFRSYNNYTNFDTNNRDRKDVIYAGYNSGILHAFDSKTGKELWGFVPPLVAPNLPLVMNRSLNKTKGGTNAVFGVDGSPVIHDAFIRGYNFRGELEGSRSWRTLLFIPYGRGGAGFSVLDITVPTVTAGTEKDDGTYETGTGPLHMFSIYNDSYNKEVIRVDHNGKMTRLPYQSATLSLEESFEGVHAANIYEEAETKDIALGTYYDDNGTPDDTSDDAPDAQYFRPYHAHHK